jgi:transcription elongation GreA/GreB family factor
MSVRNRISTKEPPAEPEPIYLTPEGHARLQGKLARLKRELPAFIEETARTAAYGDRSDNAEYKDAKSTLRRTQRQIWTIEDQLKRIVLIEPGRNAAGTAHLGSTVTLEFPDATQQTFEVVGPFETNPSKGRISHLSPLGTALVGHKAGETITVNTVNGPRNYRVLEVR